MNTSATLARPAPPRIEVAAIEIRQQLVNRLIGNRGYTATLRYSAGQPVSSAGGCSTAAQVSENSVAR